MFLVNDFNEESFIAINALILNLHAAALIIGLDKTERRGAHLA
jgi:hypothetical protein